MLRKKSAFIVTFLRSYILKSNSLCSFQTL